MAQAKVLRKGRVVDPEPAPDVREALPTTYPKSTVRRLDPADESMRQIVGGFPPKAPVRDGPAPPPGARSQSALGRADRRGVTAVSLLEQIGACEDESST